MDRSEPRCEACKRPKWDGVRYQGACETECYAHVSGGAGEWICRAIARALAAEERAAAAEGMLREVSSWHRVEHSGVCHARYLPPMPAASSSWACSCGVDDMRLRIDALLAGGGKGNG